MRQWITIYLNIVFFNTCTVHRIPYKKSTKRKLKEQKSNPMHLSDWVIDLRKKNRFTISVYSSGQITFPFFVCYGDIQKGESYFSRALFMYIDPLRDHFNIFVPKSSFFYVMCEQKFEKTNFMLFNGWKYLYHPDMFKMMMMMMMCERD